MCSMPSTKGTKTCLLDEECSCANISNNNSFNRMVWLCPLAKCGRQNFKDKALVNKSRRLEVGAHRASDSGAAIMLESLQSRGNHCFFSVN